MNKVLLTGKVARTKEFDNCTFITIATRDKHSENNTEFIECVLFGSTAEFFNKYFCTGKSIEIQGKLKQGRDYKLECIAEEIGFCGKKESILD